MKLEKREITLNEIDSVKDVLIMEKTLLREYAFALEQAERRESRNFLSEGVKNAAKEVFFLSDSLETLEENAI